MAFGQFVRIAATPLATDNAYLVISATGGPDPASVARLASFPPNLASLGNFWRAIFVCGLFGYILTFVGYFWLFLGCMSGQARTK